MSTSNSARWRPTPSSIWARKESSRSRPAAGFVASTWVIRPILPAFLWVSFRMENRSAYSSPGSLFSAQNRPKFATSRAKRSYVMPPSQLQATALSQTLMGGRGKSLNQ